MKNSSVSFIKISSFLNAPPTQRSIYFSNISFRDMHIQTRSKLIDTEGLEFDSKVRVEFSNLTFDKVSYSTKGYLMNLGHLSSDYLLIKDSSFTNLNSAKILIESVSSPTKSAKVKLINSKFDSFYSETESLISVYNEAVVEIQNCSFSNLHTLVSGAAISAGASKASVTIENSSFVNNSAVEGAVFNAQSESQLRCNN
jgi:hypothetical protein